MSEEQNRKPPFSAKAEWLTIPGDPLCGYLLAVRGSIGWEVFLAVGIGFVSHAGVRRWRSFPALVCVSRAWAVLIGAACAHEFTLPVIAAAGAIAIFALSLERPGKTYPFLPLLALAVGIGLFPSYAPHVNSRVFFTFSALALSVCFLFCRKMQKAAEPLAERLRGRSRLLLLFLQAAFCAGSNTGWFGGGPALLLLALAPIGWSRSAR